MKKPKDNVFILIAVDPIQPLGSPSTSPTSASAQARAATYTLHGQDAMDSNSDGDNESDRSNKSLIPDGSKDNRKSAKASRWLRTQFTNIRTSRTRQSLIAFFFVVVAVLLGVLLWLHGSGRLHEALKVCTCRKEGEKERHRTMPIIYYLYFVHWSGLVWLGARMQLSNDIVSALPMLPMPILRCSSSISFLAALQVGLGISNLQFAFYLHVYIFHLPFSIYIYDYGHSHVLFILCRS